MKTQKTIAIAVLTGIIAGTLSFGLGRDLEHTASVTQLKEKSQLCQDFAEKRSEQLLSQLPNYNDPEMLDGDGLGGFYVSTEKVLQDLREKYQKALHRH